MFTKAIGIFFSPTGNSRKSVEAMAKAIGQSVELIDVSTKVGVERSFGADEFVIFGAPIYGGRIPAVAMARLQGFRGANTPCIVVGTYGNRHYDDAVLELADMATAQGFRVLGGAALVGRHTFGEIQVDRPNADDLAQDAAFAQKVAAKGADGALPAIPGNRPYKDGGNGGKFRPLTSDSCVRCGMCAANCPMQAIGPDFRTIDDTKCISCFRCIRNCPVQAKNMNVDAYNAFAADFSAKLAARRENEYWL